MNTNNPYVIGLSVGLAVYLLAESTKPSFLFAYSMPHRDNAGKLVITKHYKYISPFTLGGIATAVTVAALGNYLQ